MARKIPLTDADKKAVKAKKKARKVPAKGAAAAAGDDQALKKCLADKYRLEEKYMVLQANYEAMEEELDYVSREDEKKGVLIQKYSTRLETFQNDFEKFKKRAKKEQEDALEFAGEGLAVDLLEVIDNMDRALVHEAGGDSALKSGLERIHRQLMDSLESHGIKRMESTGTLFDPKLHEAISQVTDPSVTDGTIKEVQREGYVLKDKVIRPASVVVATGGPAPPPKEEPEKAEEKAGGEKGADRKEGEAGGKGGGEQTGKTGKGGGKKGSE